MEMPKRSWLVRTTAVDPLPELDAESIAVLMQYDKEREEAEEARWKIIFEKFAAKEAARKPDKDNA
jgi:hypothetical protein